LKAPKPATEKQIKFLVALGVPFETARRFDRRQASNEISLRKARREAPPLRPVGPKLHGPMVQPQSNNYRLAVSRAVSGPGWL
jgi:hypothetical protein